MSDTTSKISTESLIPVLDVLPEQFSLKKELRQSSACETWDVFDRLKKKKFILKRIRISFLGSDSPWESVFGDLLLQEKFKQKGKGGDLLPTIALMGHDADEIWWIREPFDGRSLAESVLPGRSLRPFDAARRFVSLCVLLTAWHQAGLVHGNLKPDNIFFYGVDGAVFLDADAGGFRTSPTNSLSDPALLGPISFLAPEQQPGADSSLMKGPQTDLWALAASLAFALTGKTPLELDMEELPESFRLPIQNAMQSDPSARGTLARFQTELEQIAKTTKPSAFKAGSSESSTESNSANVSPSESSSVAVNDSFRSQVVSSPGVPVSGPGSGIVNPAVLEPKKEIKCPQCQTPVVSTSERSCSHCGRSFWEPCLNCQTMNPFWLRQCRSCGSDLAALKQQMFATLNGQKQQILKYRETYGHDKTLPILKYMSTVSHPDFAAFREWAKSMTALVHKERRDIKTYIDGIKLQVRGAMDAQKYEKVQQILEQVPRPLFDEELKQKYVEAGDCLTEVDSLIREIRNAIATKQYSPLLSCVQRYLELKANDPEAQNLQQKIEKLTTVRSQNGIKLRRIPNGRFYMGSHDSDDFLRNNEKPQHRVQITRSLFVGVYPVTQQEFMQIMEFNPSVATDNPLCPVDSVTWFSSAEFCNKMSELEGLPPYYDLKGIKRKANGGIDKANISVLGGDGYRLLTEAEWEYTCRAGSITPWCFGDLLVDVGQYAWYYDNSMMETHPVGEKKPNAWGLFDMHGNVMEWCHDWYGEFYYQQCTEEEDPKGPEDGVAKVLRGGAWQFGGEATRSAYRNSSAAETASSVIGFRICRNANDDAM